MHRWTRFVWVIVALTLLTGCTFVGLAAGAAAERRPRPPRILRAGDILELKPGTDVAVRLTSGRVARGRFTGITGDAAELQGLKLFDESDRFELVLLRDVASVEVLSAPRRDAVVLGLLGVAIDFVVGYLVLREP